jgi:hypothetical protein
MAERERDMRAVKAAAKAEFKEVPGVEGFGIGDGSLRVYVRNADVRKKLPPEFRGAPVEFVIVGDVSALSATP